MVKFFLPKNSPFVANLLFLLSRMDKAGQKLREANHELLVDLELSFLDLF